jgi:hypothetical protein
MALCPFADKRWLIPPGSNDPRIFPRLAILHTDGGDAYNLGDWFDGPSGGIESHFHVPKDGYLFQYRDTGWEADANYLANPFAISIETQGTGYENWTDLQIATIFRLLRWLHAEHPAIELRRVTAWDGTGVGYHVQFGAPGPWTPSAKICPGPKRIGQYNNLIIPGLNGDWIDMATEAEIRAIIRQEVGSARIVVNPKGEGGGDDVVWSLNRVLRALMNDQTMLREVIQNNANRIRDSIIAALPSGTSGGLTQEQVEEAVERGVRDGFGGLDA